MASVDPLPRPQLPPERVLAAYHDGVRALGHLAAKTIEWSVPTPCFEWSLLDLTGHVLCVARYYHRLLNAASAGTPLDRLPRGASQDSFNAAELVALGPMPGEQRVVAFDAVARRYGERLEEVDWDTTLGSWEGYGPLTVGQHTLLAVREWHIHAWDVARSFRWDYRPDDPEVVAAGEQLLGLPARRPDGDRWEAALVASGRRPKR